MMPMWSILANISCEVTVCKYVSVSSFFFFFFRYTVLLQDVEDYVLLHAWVKHIYINFESTQILAFYAFK